MSWTGYSGWASQAHAGQYSQGGYYSQGITQPHYANAYYYNQQGPSTHQPTQITIPPAGFSRMQPMAALVPPLMRNRVGPVRCGHEGCPFAGSAKEVEVHKMDRHLIFPPGWEEQKKGKGKRKRDGAEDDYVDEEAQFRANGGASIYGTDIKLDSPEAIAAWLEERKKRWPSAKRITEKAQRRQEALERGQLFTVQPRPNRLATDSKCSRPSRGRGRDRGRGRSHEHSAKEREDGRSQTVRIESGWSGRGRGVGGRGGGFERGRGRGRGRGGITSSGHAGASSSNTKASVDSSPSSSTESTSDLDSDSDSDDSGSDVDLLKDAVSSKLTHTQTTVSRVELQGPDGGETTEPAEEPTPAPAQPRNQVRRKGPIQPPKPTYNPFNQRPNLLRSLLVPDIQATVSNLSQAIRFLVANDFLDNVELKPGDANDVPIQPLDTEMT